MNIIEALKTKGPILSYAHKSLFYDENINMWAVRETVYRKHNTVLLIETEDEEEAVEVLLREEKY